jgi:Ferredoxin-like domain in Api92-like protein
MPNWCMNALKVEVNEDSREFFDILRSGKEGEPPFFGLFFPMPEEVRGVDQQWRAASSGEEAFTALFRGGERLSDEEVARLAEEHGQPDWHTWATENWGTKWDMGCVQNVRDGDVVLYFDTAWEPPREFVARLSRRWPSVAFTLAWAEPGMDACGEEVWLAGDGLEVVTGYYYEDSPTGAGAGDGSMLSLEAGRLYEVYGLW